MPVQAEDYSDEKREAAAAFVPEFARCWADPDLDSFCEILQPDVRLLQPIQPAAVGHDGFREAFAQLFALVPDLVGHVEGWSFRGDTVYIELALLCTLGGRALELRTCDRIDLRDGKVAEREAYIDLTPLLLALVRSPKVWVRWWKSGLGPPTRRRRIGPNLS